MKKKLDTSSVMNELRGQSVFFPNKKELLTPEEEIQVPEPPAPSPTSLKKTKEKTKSVVSRHHDTMTPRNHDTMVSNQEQDIIEIVRKAVRQIGKEAATQRLTLEEKQALADIEYSYKRQGIRTSGNEIVRIAINYVMGDYHKNGENSILAQVLKKLNS